MTAKTVITELGLQQLEEGLAHWIAMLEVVTVDNMHALSFIGTRPHDATIEWDWDLSLAKWIVLVRQCQAGRMVRNGGASTCGLCMRYYWDPNCVGCPIREHTGYGACGGTPFSQYYDARSEGNLPEMTVAATEEFSLLLDLYQRWEERQNDSPIWKESKPNG